MENQKACEMCRKDLDRQLEVAERRLNAHSEKLEKLVVIVEKLVQYQEGEKERARESHDMIKALVENALNRDSEPIKLEPVELIGETSKKIYEMPWFGWIVKGGVIIAILLVVAAIGQTIPDEVWANLFN